jgi:hypothetical protein
MALSRVGGPCRRLTAAESGRLRKPRMQRVESRALDAIGYDGRARRLFVNFRGRSFTYVYLAVPAAVWRALLAAESRGRFVAAAIKPGHDCWRLSERLRASAS